MPATVMFWGLRRRCAGQTISKYKGKHTALAQRTITWQTKRNKLIAPRSLNSNFTQFKFHGIIFSVITPSCISPKLLSSWANCINMRRNLTHHLCHLWKSPFMSQLDHTWKLQSFYPIIFFLSRSQHKILTHALHFFFVCIKPLEMKN